MLKKLSNAENWATQEDAGTEAESNVWKKKKDQWGEPDG